MYSNCILQGVLAGVTAMIQFSALDPISTPYLIPVSTLLSSFSPLSNKHSYCIISAPVLISDLSFNKRTLLHHVLYFFIYFSLSSITTIFPEIFLILLFVSVLFKMICAVILNKNLNTVSLEQVKIFKKWKCHSSSLWKAFQIITSYFLLYRHFKNNKGMLFWLCELNIVSIHNLILKKKVPGPFSYSTKRKLCPAGKINHCSMYMYYIRNLL